MPQVLKKWTKMEIYKKIINTTQEVKSSNALLTIGVNRSVLIVWNFVNPLSDGLTSGRLSEVNCIIFPPIFAYFCP